MKPWNILGWLLVAIVSFWTLAYGIHIYTLVRIELEQREMESQQ